MTTDEWRFATDEERRKGMMHLGGKIVIQRLHALVARGYRPELGIKGRESIDLTHPTVAPELTLWDNGDLLKKWGVPADRIIAHADDETGLQAFLVTIPKPPYIKRFIMRTIARSLGLAVFVVIAVVFFSQALRVFHWLSGIFHQ